MGKQETNADSRDNERQLSEIRATEVAKRAKAQPKDRVV